MLQLLANAPSDQIEMILHIATLKEFSKGEYFIREGEIPNKFAYNCRGLFRYYIDSDGNDFTKGFFPANTIISSYSAMIHNRGSYFNIEALEDSTLLIINFDDWQHLFKGHVCWKTFLIAMLETGYCTKETRERKFLLCDAETRYRSFLNNFPDLDKRIKQHYIASYLGITPVALSRIRKKMGVINTG